RQFELDRFLDAGHGRDLDRSMAAKSLDHVVDQYIRRRGTSGEPDAIHTSEPFRLHLAAVGNEIARDAALLADLAQTIGVRAVARADHDQEVNDLRQLANS